MYKYLLRHIRKAPDMETLKSLFELAKQQNFSRKEMEMIYSIKNHRKEELLIPF